MGFAWSPAIAQGISMTLAKLAIERAGYQAVSPLADKSEIPPFWEVRDEQGNVKGYVIAYLDNMMMVMDDVNHRDTLRRELTSVLADARVVVKEAPGARDGMINGPDEEHTATFLGVTFRTQDHRVMWKHADASKWQAMTVHARMRRRQVAAIVGTLMWHWAVEGVPLGSVRDVSQIARRLGGDPEESWDTYIDLTAGEMEVLRHRLGIMREAGETWQQRREQPFGFSELRLVASDSSGKKGAYVVVEAPVEILVDETKRKSFLEALTLTGTTQHSWKWTKAESDGTSTYINRLETKAAVAGVIQATFHRQDGQGDDWCLVIAAIDNSVACCALSNFAYPADEVTEVNLLHCSKVWHKARVKMIPVQVRSAEQPADELSRDRDTDLGKLKECLESICRTVGRQRGDLLGFCNFGATS